MLFYFTISYQIRNIQYIFFFISLSSRAEMFITKSRGALEIGVWGQKQFLNLHPMNFKLLPELIQCRSSAREEAEANESMQQDLHNIIRSSIFWC